MHDIKTILDTKMGKSRHCAFRAVFASKQTLPSVLILGICITDFAI